MATISTSLDRCIENTGNNVKVISNLLEDLCGQKKSWQPDNPDYNKIPWNLESEASKDPKWEKILESKGIYIFGNGKIIRYVGKAEDQSLHKRLRSRYVGGKTGGKSQCQIAKSITKDLNTRSEMKKYKTDYKVNYNSVFDDYKPKYRGQKVSKQRLLGALDFTYHGIEDMWFTAFKIEDPNYIASIESMFILAAKRIMDKKVEPTLLNDKN